MNNEVQKMAFIQEFFFKRLYNQLARARGKNTYVQELVDEVKHTVDSCEDLFLWLRQNLDQYWATRFPWTVEVTGFSDIPYLKVTFDYKLNEKGELYVLDNWCSKNSLGIPDEYFSKCEVDVDVVAHFNKEPNMIVIDYRTEI
jgi:hypothetical protein